MDRHTEVMALFLAKPLNADTLGRLVAYRANLVRACIFHESIPEDAAAALVFCDEVLRQFKEKGFKV